MGLDVLDIIFRLERAFGVKIPRGELDALIRADEPPDIRAGDLFAFVRQRARSGGASLLDEDADADVMWPMFQQVLADSLGIDPAEVEKDRGILRDLGAG